MALIADRLPVAPGSLGSPLHPPAFGRYRGAVADVGTSAWDQQPLRRRWQRKAWIYAGVFTSEWSLGVAVADAGYLGMAFLYVFHRPSGRYVEEKLARPFAFASGFQPGLHGPWTMAGGQRSWRITGQPGAGSKGHDTWRLEFAGRRLRCDLLVQGDLPGLTAIAPATSRPFSSTYKVVGVPVTGTLAFDGEPLPVADAFGALDFTLGYPPRETRWNWACLVGTTADGRRFGLNAVAHFNQDLENALWLGGDLVPLGETRFRPGHDRRRDTWHIETRDEALTIAFEPEGARSETIRLGLIASRFTQPFGRFTGTLRDGAATVAVRGHGVVEDHFARW